MHPTATGTGASTVASGGGMVCMATGGEMEDFAGLEGVHGGSGDAGLADVNDQTALNVR